MEKELIMISDIIVEVVKPQCLHFSLISVAPVKSNKCLLDVICHKICLVLN